MPERVLITGAAGFIGFHLSKFLVEKGYEVLGVDNLNDYYDTNLKQSRLNILRKHQCFDFALIDISNREQLTISFNKFKPSKVINLAAQAGVRYSLTNPYAYMESNLVGFLNVIELCRQNDVNGFIYASSSSVYGSNEKKPFSVDDRVDHPISLYAASKRANELIAHSYSHLFDLNTTGLRFFTVYGPWGRPDMAMYIFTDRILNGKPIQVYNNGNMRRDFTYIDDIIDGIYRSMLMNYKHAVFNLGNNKSENLLDLIKLIEIELAQKANLIYEPMQPGDVKESYADISASIEKLEFNPRTDISEGVPKFIKWYKNYHNIK